MDISFVLPSSLRQPARGFVPSTCQPSFPDVKVHLHSCSPTSACCPSEITQRSYPFFVIIGAALCGSISRRRGKTKQFCKSFVARNARGGEETPKLAPNLKDGDAIFNFVDEEAMLASSTFPIKPKELIARCKEVLLRGVGTKDGGSDFADEFVFCAPFVGPIGKQEYLNALASFKIQDGFPDTKSNCHFFNVDPFEPNRVWYQTRKTATHTAAFMGKPATGKALTFPPESYSMSFDESGKVTKFTVGYVIDRQVGNTGGLGGAFGYFYGVGNPLPIPECHPYEPSVPFRLLGLMGNLRKLLPNFQK